MGLLALFGCVAGSLTAEDAALAFEAVTTVNADTYADIYAFSAPDGDATGAGKDLTWNTDAGGGDVSGAVEGPGSWTGTVEVTGTYTVTLVSADVWSAVWALEASYVDVQYGGVALDGDIRWGLAGDATRSTFLHTSSVDGDIVVSGAASGAAPIVYTTTVSLAGGRYQVQTVGTVGEFDVSSAYDATAFGL
jgi:hypothetical protein